MRTRNIDAGGQLSLGTKHNRIYGQYVSPCALSRNVSAFSHWAIIHHQIKILPSDSKYLHKSGHSGQ